MTAATILRTFLRAFLWERGVPSQKCLCPIRRDYSYKTDQDWSIKTKKSFKTEEAGCLRQAAAISKAGVGIDRAR